MAVGLHLLVAYLIGRSIAATKLNYLPNPAGAAGGAISVSLARASTSGLHAASSPDQINSIAETLQVSQPGQDAPVNRSSATEMLQEMDALTPSSHDVAHAMHSSSHTTGPVGSGVTLKSQDNPWAHASVVQIDPSKTNEFWAAVKPCWRGGPGVSQVSIRVVLSDQGVVTDMTSLGAASADRSSAERLASAINACGPYTFARGRAFLVVGPL